MTSKSIFASAVLALSALPMSSQAADWVNMEKNGNIAYFFVASPAKVERYDISSRTWLAPIPLATDRGPLSYGTIDADGIYAAYDKAVVRHGSGGANETHLFNAAGTVQSLFTDGNLLLVNHSVSLYAKLTSVSKTTNTVIATFENYIYAAYGASIARSHNRLFGTSRGISPADVTYVEYTDAGQFVGGGDSPHHGSYNIGTRTWVFPGEGRFVDTTGNVYGTGNLSYSLSFGTTIDDLSFVGDDVPVVLSGGKITAYTNSLLPAGSYQLSSAAKNIIVSGDSVIAFKSTTGDDIQTEIVPLSSLNAPQPGQPVNPKGLAYVPDDVFTDNAGIVHLFSKAHQTIFRWDPVQQAYIGGLPLLGTPDFVAYSGATQTLYTSYTSGLVRKIDLTASQPAEVPFAQLPTAARGLSTAGSYLFACDSSGAWNTHYTFAPNGTKVSSKDWNYYSRSYVWNETNQKMYFFRDDTSPNDILWEEINANGTAYPTLAPGALGTTKDSPLHGDIGFTHPIRPSPNGSVVALGGGVLHDGSTLARLPTGLGNSFTDGVWGTGALYSMRSISGLTQFQKWTQPSYGQSAVAQLPGTPRRLLGLGNEKFLALVSGANGVPNYYVVDSQFNVVAPDVLAAPEGLAAAILGATQVSLSWLDINGESGYRVERKTGTSGSWGTVGTTTIGVNTFTDSGAALGNTYSYRVVATNGTKESTASDATSIEFALPEAPVITASSVGSSQIRIDWSPSARANTYKLYRKTTAAVSWSLVTSPAGNIVTYLDSSLAAGTTYNYKLVAINALGSSVDSALVSATTSQIPPDAPYLYSLSVNGPTSVWLTWSGSRAESFLIERRLGTTGTWAPVTTVTGNTFQYLDSTVEPVTTYNYRIYSTNSAGISGYSTVRTITTPEIPLPSVPLNLTAEPASGPRIDLSWSDSTNENGYRLERQLGESEWVLLATLPADSYHYQDEAVTAGNYYNYRVVAFNERGDSTSAEVRIQASEVGALVLETFDPAITYPYWTELSGASVTTGPQGFLSGNALWQGGNSLRQVTLAGLDLSMGGLLKFQFRAGNTAVDGAARWDNSEAGEGVVVEYSANNGQWEVLANLNTQYPFHSSWESHELALPSAARSASTRFRWRQLQHSGSGLDTWALDEIEVKGVLPELPDAPPFVMGTANSSRVVALSWVAGTGATSYVVERRTPTTAWTAVGSAAVGQTYFMDETALPATIYSYRIIARNASGDSPPSNYILVTTWSTLSEWRFQNYGTLSPGGNAALLEDNGTGIPNIIRFAFNMAASDQYYQVQNQFFGKGMPNIQMHSPTGLLRVAFIRRRAETNPGITYAVEFSDNILHWNPAGSEILTAPIDENFEYVVWEDEPSSAGKKFRFVRVRVQE